MNKLPPVERDRSTKGLTGERAYKWALFLADEADMMGDICGYDRFKSIADRLEPRAGKPAVAGFFCKDLEEAIEAWTK